MSLIHGIGIKEGVLIYNDEDKNKLIEKYKIIPDTIGKKKMDNHIIECEPYLIKWSIAIVCNKLNYLTIHLKECIIKFILGNNKECNGCYNELIEQSIEQSINYELVIKDLLFRGYYINSASKFGGDFAIYKTIPSESHSISIIHILLNNKITSEMIMRYGRSASLVKKTALLAIITEDLQVYKSNL